LRPPTVSTSMYLNFLHLYTSKVSKMSRIESPTFRKWKKMRPFNNVWGFQAMQTVSVFPFIRSEKFPRKIDFFGISGEKKNPKNFVPKKIRISRATVFADVGLTR
jgi:hypothetical protein